MSDYTPTTEVIRHAVSFPRERLGEPRPIKPEAFDRWLEQVKARARADALADAGLLARPLPTREEIAMAIAARHWDRDSGDVEVWHDLTLGEREAVAENYLTWDSAYAVIALLKGQEA